MDELVWPCKTCFHPKSDHYEEHEVGWGCSDVDCCGPCTEPSGCVLCDECKGFEEMDNLEFMVWQHQDDF